MNNMRPRCFAVAVIACVYLGVVARLCRAQQAAPEYSVQEDAPRTGSIIRHDQVSSTILPLNRTYQQLTPEQRGYVNSWYEYVAPGDEPPFPLDGLRPIFDAVRKGQEKLGVRGRLLFVATVEPDGKVSTVKAYGSPSPEMANFVGTVLLITKFKPAVCSGRPCRMDFPLSYQFKVR
jgi:hypothetical protein